MDDLEELQSRVAAAQEKLRMSADDQRKYGLRLNDVVAIVEGSLARQQEEMQRLQAAAVELRVERDAARHAEAELKAAYEAALAKIAKRETQNEQLRNMVLTLLNVIEGREPASALQDIMQRLEQSLQQLAQPQDGAASDGSDEDRSDSHEESAAASLAAQLEQAVADDEAAVTTEEPVGEAVQSDATAEAPDSAIGAEVEAEETAAETADLVETLADAETLPDDAEDAGLDAEEVEPDLVEPQAEAAGEQSAADAGEGKETAEPAEAATEDADPSADMPEDLEDISMQDHQSLVADPEAQDQPSVTVTDEGAEPLVSALLDAEKALIAAGANGLSEGDSPVAEIIRRISLRTREFSQAANR